MRIKTTSPRFERLTRQQFWRQLPKEFGGGRQWPVPIIIPGHMETSDILMPKTCYKLVNLYHGLRMHYTEYERFDLDQFAKMMRIELDWASLAPELTMLRRDCARNGYPGETWLGMLRKGRRPERFDLPEQESPDTQWLLPLAVPPEGAQLYFPSCGMVYEQRPGKVVSWPRHYGHGIAPFTEGKYFYFLEGVAYADRAKEIKWPMVTDPETLEIIK